MRGVETVVEDDAASGRDYTVVVALDEPDPVEQLMRTAIDLAADRDGQIRAVTVVHKPATSPFLLFSDDRIKREFAGAENAILDAAVAAAEGSPVPVRRSLVVGSNVSSTLRSVIAEAEADALVLGWRARPRPTDVVLGTTVDPLIRRGPCDVFVERVGTTADGLALICLPTVGGPHVDPATDLAGAVARANDAAVRVVSFVPPEADDADRAAAETHVAEATERLPGVEVEGGVEAAGDVAEALVAAADASDFVVLGATREARFRRGVVGSVAETVAQRVDPPVVIAKRRSTRSWLARRIGRWRA